MWKPSEKTPEMESALEAMMGRTTHITNGTCTTCNKEVVEFRDKLSEREYEISGMCQECQDSVFGGPND